ncbi:putative choline transporter, neither null mutation nor overexpression affects choline transport [Phytophthora pseudosyringae]|uniref:Putative choline transporter, neither null mutation nor overexpression affects choline transport n=1 Tax=Phytophthora pseudosyringae TaxID=221518 RepID=A0A8T1VW86_9STRA|nr:putative choline transporter, neither null mutation nor overexpression affects choline transport [Phytophthora pseudosyringae]
MLSIRGPNLAYHGLLQLLAVSPQHQSLHLARPTWSNSGTKSTASHFRASPNDGVVRPWQHSLLGHYSEVVSLEEIGTTSETLTVVDMEGTVECPASRATAGPRFDPSGTNSSTPGAQ